MTREQREDRRTLIRQIVFVAMVAATFVVLLYATAATVSDEEIRADPTVRAQAH